MGPIRRRPGDPEPPFRNANLDNALRIAQFRQKHAGADKLDASQAFKTAPDRITHAPAFCEGYNAKNPLKSDAFSRISIALPCSIDNFGDVMSTLKLAKGLKREFPDKEIVMHIGEDRDLRTLETLCPGLDISKFDVDGSRRSGEFQGIRIINGTWGFSNLDVEKDVVCVRLFFEQTRDQNYRHLPRDGQGKPFITRFLLPASLNLYVQEYDSAHMVTLPEGMEPNRAYRDRTGRLHMVVRTGFYSGSAGIHIDPDLAEKKPDGPLDARRPNFFDPVDPHDPEQRWQRLREASKMRALKILERDGFEPGDYARMRWAVAYHNPPKEVSWQPFQEYMFAFEHGYKEDAPAVVFNFSRMKREDFERMVEDFPWLNHVFLGEGDIQTHRPSSPSNITAVYCGPVPHEDFLRFMGESELPAFVTGDMSLSEAISMDKLYIYQTPDWKQGIVYYAIDLAKSFLNPYDAAVVEELFRLNRQPGTMSALFYDKHVRDALKEFNMLVREVKDLPHNLAGIIRDGLALI